MTTAQEILKLIETVDPDDTARLDEIDARAFAYTNKMDFAQLRKHRSGRYLCDGPFDSVDYVPQYTRSRDALKAIRPEGWVWSINTDLVDREKPAWASATLYSDPSTQKTLKAIVVNRSVADGFKTEELAELHAIIQAIDYDRKAKNDHGI